MLLLLLFVDAAVLSLVSGQSNQVENGRVWAGTNNAGVWLYQNNSWRQSSNGIGNANVKSIQINPFNYDILLAVTSDAVYKTTDGGQNWIPVVMPVQQNGWNKIFWDRAREGDVIISGPELGEVYETDPLFAMSHDGGDSWHALELDLDKVGQAFPGDVWGFNGVWYLIGNSGLNLYFWPCTRTVMWRSMNAGAFWEKVCSWPGNKWYTARHVTGLWSDPTHLFGTFDHLYANSIVESFDAGSTWIDGDLYLSIQRQILADPVRDNTLWLVAQNRLYVSSTGASGFQLSLDLGKNLFTAAVDGHVGVVYGAGDDHRMAFSVDAGQTWVNAYIPEEEPITKDTDIISLAVEQPPLSLDLVISDILPADTEYVHCSTLREIEYDIYVTDGIGNPVSGATLAGYDAVQSNYFELIEKTDEEGHVVYATMPPLYMLPNTYAITFTASKAGYNESQTEMRYVMMVPTIPEPNNVGNNGEHVNLWRDLQAQYAHALLCPDYYPPGEGQKIAIIDWDLWGVSSDGQVAHGSWTAQLAAGPLAQSMPGYGIGDLPGIAAGASLFTLSPLDRYRWSEDFHKLNCLLLNWACGEMGDAIVNAFKDIVKKIGPGGVIGLPLMAWVSVKIPMPDPLVDLDAIRIYLTKGDALWLLREIKDYIKNENGVVVLPSNIFASEVANNKDVKQKLQESGALVAHAVKRGAHPRDECDASNIYCATSRAEINIAVPTTNNNNSVAVPAVAATAVLMRNANRDLSNDDILTLITNETGVFETVQINGSNQYVGILDAYKAVKAAKDYK
ncbi:hypothetical protein JXA70_08410 [candidate division KSB1 bacterium]|nr:hypothetical protein [candidate division KSB1 bacterium]